MPPPRVEVPEPEPVLLPDPPPRVPLLLPEELGGIVFGQGRSDVARQLLPPPTVSNAEAEAGSIATRTAAARTTPIAFFMTFSFFKTRLCFCFDSFVFVFLSC